MFGPVMGYVLYNAEEEPEDQFILHPPGDATITLWVKPGALNAHSSWFWTRGAVFALDQNRFNIQTDDGAAVWFDYREEDGTLHAFMQDVGAGTAARLDREVWTHIAITRIGNEYRIWKNGVGQQPATDASPALPSSLTWALGKPIQSGPLIASIDEVAFFDTALSEADIKTVMKDPLGVSPKDRLAHTWGAIKATR